VSNRYGIIKDSSGNPNNFYDPRKQRSEKKFNKAKYVPQARAEIEFNMDQVEEQP
jgi:hypothetical protein